MSWQESLLCGGQRGSLMHSGKSHIPSVKCPEVWEDLVQVIAFPPNGPFVIISLGNESIRLTVKEWHYG